MTRSGCVRYDRYVRENTKTIRLFLLKINPKCTDYKTQVYDHTFAITMVPRKVKQLQIAYRSLEMRLCQRNVSYARRKFNAENCVLIKNSKGFLNEDILQIVCSKLA